MVLNSLYRSHAGLRWGFSLHSLVQQRSKETAARQAYQRLHGVLIPVMIVALLASLGHLGRPMQALSSLGNLGTSWLSREIFFTGGFFVLLVLMVLLKRNDGVRRVLAWLTGLAGVAAVISMAMIYHMSIMPAWQGYGTFVAFGGTTFFLGAALAAVVLLGRGLPGSGPGSEEPGLDGGGGSPYRGGAGASADGCLGRRQ